MGKHPNIAGKIRGFVHLKAQKTLILNDINQFLVSADDVALLGDSENVLV